MSVVDGPGNRTAIFFQGCQMDCIYCHNPETIALFNDKMNHVIANIDTLKEQDEILLYDVDTLVKRVVKNKAFIRGVTVSGGECTLQYPFLTAFFKALQPYGLTRLVDTNGGIALEPLKAFVDVCDGFILDIKAFDEQDHLDITFSSNKNVLENAVFLARIGKLHEIRTVCIDGLNNRNTVIKITEMLKPYLKVRDISYKIIKYRPHGVRQPFASYAPPSQRELLQLLEIAQSNGFKNATIV